MNDRKKILTTIAGWVEHVMELAVLILEHGSPSSCVCNVVRDAATTIRSTAGPLHEMLVGAPEVSRKRIACTNHHIQRAAIQIIDEQQRWKCADCCNC